MKSKKAVLLFEVALVILLVSIASLFLFRSYALFLKVGRKSSNYLKLILLAEEKIYDLQIKEKSGDLSLDMKEEGTFPLPSFSWSLELNDTVYDDLKIADVKVSSTGRRGISLDTVIYLTHSKEE